MRVLKYGSIARHHHARRVGWSQASTVPWSWDYLKWRGAKKASAKTQKGDQKEHKFIKPKQENKRGKNLMQQKHGFPEKSIKWTELCRSWQGSKGGETNHRHQGRSRAIVIDAAIEEGDGETLGDFSFIHFTMPKKWTHSSKTIKHNKEEIDSLNSV